jgi:3D (Asp-Asp-Asp) domain-containing protein
VRGKRPRSCRRVLALPLAIAAALLAAGGGGAGSTAASVPGLRGEASSLRAREHTALLDLYSVQTRLGAERSRLAVFEARAARLRAQYALVRREVAIAARAHAVSQHRLAVRLRLLYEQGEPDPVAVVLGATSLSDAIASIDDLNRTAEQNSAMSRQTASTRRSLTHLSARLAAQEEQLGGLEQQSAASVAALEQAQADRAGLVATLRTRERLTQAQLGRLEATARAAQVKSQPLARPSSSSTASGTATAPVVAGAPQSAAAGRALTVVATGYSLRGRTATGLPVGWGVVAVDPSVIPLGTHLTIPGYGEGVAADTGGGVQGATIDLWFPSLAQARAWGRRTVTVTLH